MTVMERGIPGGSNNGPSLPWLNDYGAEADPSRSGTPTDRPAAARCFLRRSRFGRRLKNLFEPLCTTSRPHGIHIGNGFSLRDGGAKEFLDGHAEDTCERALVTLCRRVDPALPPRDRALGYAEAGSDRGQGKGAGCSFGPLQPDLPEARHACKRTPVELEICDQKSQDLS
jgi:hypothetical protein